MGLRSVAYNSTQAPGMQGMMPGMQGTQMAGMQGMMPGMQGTQMAGMQGMMPGMQGTQMAGMQGMMPGMCPPSGLVNLDVNADPGCVSLDLGGAMPCSPCEEPMVCREYPPCPTPAPRPQPQPEVYVVRKGDTIYKIAQRYGTTMEAIIQANNLKNPDLIFPGQTLIIPEGWNEKCYG